MIVAAGLLAVWIAVAPSLADWLIIEKPIANADAILILSGAADYSQRARGGADVFHKGASSKILITDDGQRGGWDDTEKGNPFFVDRMQRALEAQEVPAGAIERLPGIVESTGDEADLAVRTATERGFDTLLVVTSDYHSRRALWVFEQTIKRSNSRLSVGLMRAPSAEKYPDRYTWWLTPRGWRTVGGEYLKFAYYWLFY